MLGRASKDYAARNAASTPAAGHTQKSKLERALFPSSSPRDGNIADYCKTPSAGVSTSSTSPSRSRPAANGLSFRPQNIPVHNNLIAKGSGSFVTLCKKPDQFKDSTTGSFSKVQQAEEEDLMAFGIDPDDFTDDENLNLELHADSLHAPEKPLDAVTATENAGIRLGSAPAASRPLSSSSSNLFPVSRAASVPTPLTKRLAQDGTTAFASLPAAKKRAMPQHWHRAESTLQAADSSLSKKEDSLPWNATATTMQAQKRLLKDSNSKKTGPDGADLDSLSSMISKASHAAVKPAKISLSTEQQHVKNLVCIKNKSVFFTGPAGAGKSVLMRAIIQDLRKKYKRDPECLSVTASTGLAACNIGGMTLHSFAGIGLGKEDAQTLVRKIRRNPKAKARWLKTKTLILDEVSMVDGDLFDKLSQIGRTLRNNGRPWGGIQLVLTGDFFQLPPVPDRTSRDIKFAFEAATWNTSIDHTIGLTEVFRQKDQEFASMLNEMRLGKISDKTVQVFKSLARPLKFDDGLEVTELFPTRNEVDNSNTKRLGALEGKSYRYDAHDTGDPSIKDKLLQNMMAPKSLVLCVGAQVMLIKNMDETLVNGSVGKVVKFMTESEFEIFGGNELESSANPDVVKRAAALKQFTNDSGSSGGKMYPFVLFRAADGSQRGLLVRQEEWKVELPNGDVQASRHQLPLILAWALSIHKAQGQTLERVRVDLGRVFEKGQAYVALSRATCKDGLQVLRFEKHKIMAHPRVVGFYDKLYSAESALKNSGGNASILAFTSKTEVEMSQEGPSFARSKGVA